MTTYTPNFDLPEYEPTDLPALTDQYNEAMGKVDTALQGLKDKDTETANLIAAINRELTEHAEDITNAQTDIAALQKTDGEHGAEITALQSSVAGAAQAAAKAQETADANTATIAAVKKHDDAQDAQIAANTAEISEVKTTADDALATATENQGDIMKAEGDITALTGRVSKNETDIADIQLDTEQVEKNTAAIAALTAQVSAVDVLNWTIETVSAQSFTPAGIVGSGSINVFINPSKTMFKVAGVASSKNQTNAYQPIPGAKEATGNDLLGWKTNYQVDELGVFRLYNGCGTIGWYDTSAQPDVKNLYVQFLAIGTDNILYIGNNYASSSGGFYYHTIVQTPLTLRDYDIPPIDSDQEPPTLNLRPSTNSIETKLLMVDNA